MSENDAMSAKDRLKMARDAAEAGRYAEALEGYVWFHHNALDENRHLHAVRLSFCLERWMELAGQYPPARVALKALRDEKSRRLACCSDHWGVFEDVVAINRFLGNEEATYDLFCAIVAHSRAFAKECASRARPAMIKAMDFKLARSFIDDLDQEFKIALHILNGGIVRVQLEPNSTEQVEVLASQIQYFADSLKKLRVIIHGAKSGEDIDAMIDDAIAKVMDEDVREQVRQKIFHDDDSFQTAVGQSQIPGYHQSR